MLLTCVVSAVAPLYLHSCSAVGICDCSQLVVVWSNSEETLCAVHIHMTCLFRSLSHCIQPLLLQSLMWPHHDVCTVHPTRLQAKGKGWGYSFSWADLVWEMWMINLHIDVTKLQILKHKGRHLSISCNDILLQDSIPLRTLLEPDVNKFINYCNTTNPFTIGWPQIGQTLLEAGFSEEHTDNQQQMLLNGSSWTTLPTLWITFICPLSCKSIWPLSWQPISTMHHLLTTCLLFSQRPAKSDSPIRCHQTRIPLVSIQMSETTREDLVTTLSGLGAGVCLFHPMYNHCAVVCHNIGLSW